MGNLLLLSITSHAPFFWSFYLSKPQSVHTFTKLFPTETDPQTLTQVLGLLTYRFTVPSVSPTNKNNEEGLLLETQNEKSCDFLLAQTDRHNLVSPADKLQSQS